MADTKAFIDATCPKCRKRIGWYGRIVDHPTCPRCGHRPDQANLERTQAEADKFTELLAALQEVNPGWEKWREARVAAGLTLRQAAKLFGVGPRELSEIEQGRTQPSQALAEQMARCYSGDNPGPITPTTKGGTPS